MAAIEPTPGEYAYLSKRIRGFLAERNFVESPCQSRISILAACEDHKTVGTYTMNGQVWPLIQSNQMSLERDIVSLESFAQYCLDPAGVFCTTVSYRDEPTPLPGRHLRVFDMFEVEFRGDMQALQRFQEDLLAHLGFNRDQFRAIDYHDACKQYGVDEITHKEEQLLYNDYGPTVWLCNFPRSSDPYWNMRYSCEDACDDNADNADNADNTLSDEVLAALADPVTTARKIDVILCGRESVGSAERSCNAEIMRRMFYEVDGGRYAATLFEKFGRERVEAELNDYLSLPFMPRCGMGIGVARLVLAMRELGLFPQ